MSVIGSADFDRPITFASGRIFYPFGGGPFQLEPSKCGVVTSNLGMVEFQLDLIRTLSARESRATLSCMISAEYATEEALAALRKIKPAASLTPSVLTDWLFRFVPTPALEARGELMAPVLMASNGLGTARLMMSLSIESGLLLESMLQERTVLAAIAEAQLTGVSPRVPVVVRFESDRVLSQLLERADPTMALPRRLIVDYFNTADPATLPLTISGTLDRASIPHFAEIMTDRIVARFGRYVPSNTIEDAPVVQFEQPSSNTSLVWSLSQPFITNRRVVLPVDLFSAAQNQIDRLGVDSVITRRDLNALPSFGHSRVTALCNLPASRAGVEAIGVTLTFPPYPPHRPQARTATALFESGDDIAKIDVRLSPGEPLHYRYSTFVVVSDEAGTRQINMPEAAGEGALLRLSPEHFPIEFALIEATPALAQLAVITGICTYEKDGQTFERLFKIDSGQLSVGIPIPRERSSIRIDVVAVARDGSGQISLGPFETPQVKLDLTSFPTYGPQQIEVKCVFDDSSTLQAVSLLPDGSAESAENITTLPLTPADSSRTFGWFARSPFGTGFRYRPYHAHGGAWTEVPLGTPTLVLFSSRLQRQEIMREVFTKSERGIRESLPRRPRRQTEAATTPLAEAVVVAIGTSPSPNPTDQLLYTHVDDPNKKLYVPRYVLDVQNVSGQTRYRMKMLQQAESLMLEVNLIAVPPPALGESARDAEEYRHLLTIQLEFFVSGSSGAKKTLEFTDVTRNGEIVTARLTFATLAERDDVYRVLTDPARGARLVVRRFIDVSVPQRPPAPDEPRPPRPPIRLPVRPFPERPPKWTILPKHADPPSPIVRPEAPLMKGAKLILDDGVFTSRVGIMKAGALTLHRGIESAPARSLEAGLFKTAVMGGLVNANISTTIKVDTFVPILPTPQLAFTGAMDVGGSTIYTFSIVNWSEFSDEFFAAAPDLPPYAGTQSASRTTVELRDNDTGQRIYEFVSLGSAKHVSSLTFYRDEPLAVLNVHAVMTDRRTKVQRVSNVVSTSIRERSLPPHLSMRLELLQTVEPTAFTFPPALHGYIFEGVNPGSGSNQLIRYRFRWQESFQTYYQDASRPWVVYVFPDQFKIARQSDFQFTPFVTVREVTSHEDGRATNLVFDYVVAPYMDTKRLNDARTRLLADPRFGASRVEFEPLLTSDVRFRIDRPSVSGVVREQRSDAAMILQGSLNDTLTMSLEDFKLLFDAMCERNASMFSGEVQIDVPNQATEVIRFVAKMDDLAGEIFSYEAVSQDDGTFHVALTNNIESPINIQTLDTMVSLDGQQVRGFIQGSAVPREQLLPGETIQLTIAPETAITSNAEPQITFDLSGVTVTADREAIWRCILDRSTVQYFRKVTVKAIPTLFEAMPGREAERIVSVLVHIEGSPTEELTAAALERKVHVNLPIDDVILERPVSSTFRYTLTVIRANGRQETDQQPREQFGDLFYLPLVP